LTRKGEGWQAFVLVLNEKKIEYLNIWMMLVDKYLTGKNWKENTKYINYFDIYGRGYGWQIREKGDRHLYWYKTKKKIEYPNIWLMLVDKEGLGLTGILIS
jgi:hypothetical protein